MNVDEEIADLVDQAKATPKKKRRVSRKSSDDEEGGSNGDDNGVSGKMLTMDELEVDQHLPAQSPKPAEQVKTLGDMYAKYGVGDNPEFHVQVWRTWPKMAGGKKFDGFYDTWDVPLTLEQIQGDYGGGQYRVVIVGPHPTKVNTPKHYDSMSIALAGDPNYERLPRALQSHGKKEDTAVASAFQIPAAPQSENPKLAEAALKMMQSTAESERDERRRVEERYESRRSQANEAFAPVIEAERRRSDDVIRSERERAESDRRNMQERLNEERGQREELRERMDRAENSRPSIGQEIRALAEAGLFRQSDNGGGIAKDMLTQVLEKHRGEMDAVVKGHTQFVEALRQGHASEMLAVRDAHRREVEAEREAGRSRESRVEERLGSEREERRRDQDRFKQQLDDRDTQWRDRMDSANTTMASSWEARHQSLMSTYENRIEWLQAEIDRLKSELLDARSKQEEKGDLLTQISRMSEIQEVMKSRFAPDPATSSSSSSGGIGLTGGVDWKETLAEGVAERAPAILQMLFGGGAAGGAPPPGTPPLQEGQIVQTPQGPMVAVRDPSDGQMKLAPKEALEAQQRAIAAQQQRGGLLGGPPQRRGNTRARQPEKKKKKTVSAVENFASGFPTRKPPWEGGGDDDAEDDDDDFSPPPPPRMTTRAPVPSVPDGEPIELSAQMRQGISVLAKHVHTSVMAADEPEEFVGKMMNAYDVNTLRAISGSYTTDQVLRGIAAVEPGSAGATPAGQQFIVEAMRQLRAALQEA